MSIPTTEEELLADKLFHEFLRETYSELPLEEVIYQFRQADGKTKALMRQEYYEWRKQRGYFGEIKVSSKERIDVPFPV